MKNLNHLLYRLQVTSVNYVILKSVIESLRLMILKITSLIVVACKIAIMNYRSG